MPSFNQVTLLGNATRAIELKYIQSGTAVAELGLAINEKYKDQKGEWVESTVFVDVTLWGRTAEIANQYVSKGDPVLISGKLKLDQWEQDGQKRSKLKVVGERLQLLGGKKGNGDSGGGQGKSQGSTTRYSEPVGGEMQDEPFNNAPADEDIPF